MGTPRARSPPLPPPPPAPLSAAASPSHDFSFSSSSSFCGRLPHLSMSRTPVVGRVGSDLSHNNQARATRRQTASHGGAGGNKDGDRAKNKQASPFFSGLGSVWRKDTAGGGGVGAAGGKQGEGEERRKTKEKRKLEVGQWVKKHMASMVEQLRGSFSRQTERERREQRGRPHSFSGHGPAAARERPERWRQRRRGQLSSAPASLRVSPANSGHLSVGGSVKVSTSSEESTMEELQSAIEAAIAHCKNSIARAAQADGDDRRGEGRREEASVNG
ncbi:hypothetical protein ACP4OV_023907 [Aristida adscensionis]